MTDHRAHDDQFVAHWLTQHQQALTSALDDILDTEAGLLEILIHSRHGTAVDDLGTVLDTEAGLAAILPTTPQPADPTPSAHDSPHDDTSTHEFLQTLSPVDRMTLRNHPDVKQATLELARDRAREHARDLASTRDYALGLVLALAGDLAHHLDYDLDLARSLDLDLASTRDLARDLALALDRARDYDHARDYAPDFARHLDLARHLDRALDRHLDPDLARHRVLARARDRARDLILSLIRARDRVHTRDLELVLDLARTVIHVRTAEVRRAIGLALDRDTPELDTNSLRALLDDFTTADLRDADLTGTVPAADLSGVRWSEHGTRWPPAVDIEDLKTRSDETPPGSGTWTIRSGTATIRNLAEL
ncbi:hypothetical protein [Streptomyces sp. MMBL 11-3]|uniref:hypothetical protein n=1 Tax=Streptomyces sp. MMBL 11-3 TaxID=3382639 RepID=UPI0039B57BA2